MFRSTHAIFLSPEGATVRTAGESSASAVNPELGYFLTWSEYKDAYGIEKNGELFISNMFIAEYADKGYQSHLEKRDRKLLLHHKEIVKIISEMSRKGSTLVAIRLFFNEKGLAKLEVGIGHGKKLYDKRETIKERDWNREKQRLLK